MLALPFLFRISLEGMLFALVLPWFRGGMALIATAAWMARRPQKVARAPDPRLAEVLIPFVFPLAILIWAAALYASLAGKQTGWYWQELGIFGLLLLQVVAIVWLLMRHAKRVYPAIAASALALWWAFGAMFVAGMAIYNDWL